MKWYVIQGPHNIHTVPTEDAAEHTTRTMCWCRPKWDNEADNHLIHNSFLPDEDGEGEEPDDGKYH